MTSPTSSARAELTARVRANFDDLRRRVSAAGVDPDALTIVAVTKTHGPDAVRAAASVGLSHVGENYVDELEVKRPLCEDLGLTWHYLGALQSNKIARVAAVADCVDGLSRAKEITGFARLGSPASFKLQVDFTGRDGRGGCTPEEVPALATATREAGLLLTGLMTVAPPDPRGAADAFAALRRQCDALGLKECSMGMSDDLELALAAGTTELRVGSALFGARGAVSAHR